MLKKKRDEMAANGTFNNAGGTHVNTSAAAADACAVGAQSTITKSSIIDAAVNTAHVEKCRQELQLMNIKADVMREELHEAQIKQSSSKQAIKTKETSLNMLSGEKEDALERLRKIQREIQLINDF